MARDCLHGMEDPLIQESLILIPLGMRMPRRKPAPRRAFSDHTRRAKRRACDSLRKADPPEGFVLGLQVHSPPSSPCARYPHHDDLGLRAA
jgi:hypothetical protein